MLVKPTTDVIAKIKVIGVGGGGGNAVNTMISHYNIEGVEFISINTDQQALKNSLAPLQLQIGQELTRGLGVGGDPTIGAQAAEESVDLIHENVAGADMVFLTCGMGGGTGTGATPVIAQIAKNLGALTVAVVTKPFNFEGKRRMDLALKGIDELKDKVDTLIVVPNQRLLDTIDNKISFLEALRRVDEVLAQGVKSISSLVTQAGLINVDFADVKAIMTDSGSALMGIGEATGENRAEMAAKQAISSPLLEMSIDGATGVLLNVIGGLDLSMHEVDTAAQMISDVVDPNANIIFGATIDESIKDTIQITVLATGFGASPTVIPTTKIAIPKPQEREEEERPRQQVQQQARPQQSRRVSSEDGQISGNGTDKAKPRMPEAPVLAKEDELDVPAYLRRSVRQMPR